MVYKITKTRECIVCGKTFLFSRNKIACTPECSKERAKQRLEEDRQITLENRARDKDNCIICFKEFPKRTLMQVTCGYACKEKHQKQKWREYSRNRKKAQQSHIILNSLNTHSKS